MYPSFSVLASAIIPLSSAEDKDAHVGALVVFEGACVGAFANGAGKSTAGKGDGGGSLALWGTRTMAAPVDSIVAGNGIIVAIVDLVVVVSRKVEAEGRLSPLCCCLCQRQQRRRCT